MLPENLLDLEGAVRAWAWGEFDDLADKKQRKLREKERKKPHNYINMNIDWSKVIFDDKTTEFPVLDDNKGKGEVPDANENQPRLEDTGAVHSGLAAGSSRPTMSVLFQTKFMNRTDREQEYTMKTEKTTKSAFMVETETGYSKGFDLSVTLKTPGEILEANAGYHREYSVTNISGESFEEELHWGVDSVIKVKDKHVAEAQLVVFETKKRGTFSVQTQISGRVYVTFTNVRDNNSFVMATSEDICTLLEEHVKLERKHGKRMDYVTFNSKAGIAYVTTKGTCKFEYGIRQEVQVDQSPLEGATIEEDE